MWLKLILISFQIEVLKRKPKGITIVAYMQNIFSDESLIGYNYNGVMVLGKRKRAMRVYEIFTNCFMGEISRFEFVLMN